MDVTKRRALLVVDVQNDFCEGGALAVDGGIEVAERIAEYIEQHEDDYVAIVLSQDWHEPPPHTNGGHFADEPDYVDSWPVHCVRDTEGAAIRPELRKLYEHRSDVKFLRVQKGQGIPAYSAFEGHETRAGALLEPMLTLLHVYHVDICGIATDHCVFASAKDSLTELFNTRVLTDLVAGVDPQRSAEALEEMESLGAELLSSARLGR